MYRAAFILIAMVAAVLLPACGGSSDDLVIVDDVSVDGFPRDGTVRQAIEAFGQPSANESRYDQCLLTWRSLGVAMETYYTNAALDPCGPEGRHRSTTVKDPRWRTSDGLAIGDTLRKLRELYPEAEEDEPGKWWLTTRLFVGIQFPGLEASIKDGRVVSFKVYGPRALS